MLLNFQNIIENLPLYLLRIPIVLLSLSVHECAHAWAANKMGDPSAKNLGRMTINPIKHLDPIGAVCMLLFGFGWAKPVPIYARNFDNPRKGMALSALAGPVSNLIMGILGVALYELSYTLAYNFAPAYISDMGVQTINYIIQFFYMFGILNFSLAVFNLIPVPPLDGSRIMNVFLPDKIYFGIMKYEKYIYIAIIVAISTGILSTPLSIVVNGLFDGVDYLVRLLPFMVK